MIMITEDYVSFEIAKLLKEKGFNQELDWAYYEEKGNPTFCYSVDNDGYGTTNDYKGKNFVCIAPTQQMATKWLREEKRTSIIIEFDLTQRGYNPYVYQPDYDMDWVIKWRRNLPMKYEEAVEASLKYSLENLI